MRTPTTKEIEEMSWRDAISLMLLVVSYWFMASVDYVKEKIENTYYWFKYRNWRYDK